jgi:carboxyl-terminal processing protease
MSHRFINALLIGVLGVNLYVGFKHSATNAEAASSQSVYPHMEKFSRALEQVRRNYVDEDKVTYSKLMDGALKGMLAELDPHSEYMPADRHKALLDDTRQEFGGIGIIVSMRNNWLTIISPMDDTPGARAGLQPGDRITKIKDKTTEGMGISDAVGLLRGKIGTEVGITIYRPASEKTIDISLKRERIKTKSVRDLNGKGEFKLVSGIIGYAKISGFSDNTSEELEVALVKMEEKGMRGFVLDLRDNPGGLLSQSARVTEKFVKENQLIVSTEGRNKKEQDRLLAKSDMYRKLPLVVLINEGSASASEIVAGCLQDLKRAKLIGAKTFGKGSVQSILPMRDGSALRLTTAKYFTPSHRTIHNKGIEPDYKVNMTPEQMRDVMMKRSPGIMETLEPEERDRVMNAVDPQLAKALEILDDILKAN